MPSSTQHDQDSCSAVVGYIELYVHPLEKTLCVVKAWVKRYTQIMIFIAHSFFVATKLHVNDVVLHMTGSEP